MNSEEMHNNPSEQMATKMQLISEENNVLTENTDLTFSNPNSPPVIKQKKVKKPTRQWAAWTRQEEENFFNALRQVGKNFEKITCRVQSKNKDQVRHYYYRLVRRMKKILGPNFCLDAKNSKDTIAAMLRWWSLLEKYSCTASKLHLKPRRFKIFVEALESQLIKDQKKSRRKRQQGDLFNSSSSSGNNNNNNNNNNHINNHNNNNNELDQVKLVPVENGQTGTKLPPKGSSNNKRINLDGNVNLKIGANKADLSANRTVKQKRKNGAAYKKWEKAAMAGVSLVADAAEQLERANLNNDQNSTYCNNTKEANSQPLMKLKLQLFPINESTRKALERDSHNPHLELTLSGRKRIASVLEHLNKKWGNCDVTGGDLLLVPYNADLATCQKWSVRDHVVVSDVFLSLGSPSVFRLRYGWFTNTEIGSSFCNNNGLITKGVTGNNVFELNLRKGVQCAIEQVGGNQENYMGLFNGDNSAKEWADSLTDISVGYLLSEASRAANNNNNNNNKNNNNDNNCSNLDCVESCLNERAPQFEEEMGQSSDSFDEAIAAHLSNNKNNRNNNNNNNNDSNNNNCSNNNNMNVSIWSAEETCDGFAFNAGIKEISKVGSSGSPKFKGILKDLCRNAASNQNGSSVKEIEKVDLPSDENNESPHNDAYITDINWPDSLGPLDLEAPSFKYQISDVGFSDSFNSLTRMMQSSWDAFRSLSFLGTSEN